MRWLGRLRRRRHTPRHAAEAPHRPGSWGQVAQPAPVEPANSADSADAVPERLVQLGFVDGSSVTVDAESRAAADLRQAAARLIDGPR